MRCPRRPVLEEPELWTELLAALFDFENGRLPEDGGVQSQPHWLMTALRIMVAARHEADDIKQKAEKRPD